MLTRSVWKPAGGRWRARAGADKQFAIKSRKLDKQSLWTGIACLPKKLKFWNGLKFLIKDSIVPVLILLFFTQMLFAQEEDLSVYYIREIYVDITGRTSAYALLRNSEIKKGDEVKGAAGLQKYIEDKKQTLMNRRELQEVNIDFAPADPDSGGRIPVDITIHTVDTRNFIIVPEPKYNSNTGWSPTLRIRDFNFLGLMTPLRINFTYRYNDGDDVTYSRNNITFLLGFEIPFEAFGYDWTVNTENVFSYFVDEPFSYGGAGGISVDIPLKNTTFTFGFEQRVNFEKEYDNWQKYIYNKNLEDVWYGTSKVYGEWKVPLPVETESMGNLIYKPALSTNVNYAFRGEDLAEHKGAAVNMSQKLGFTKIDWAGNYRRGADLYIENRNEYNFFFEGWNNSITVNATEHLVITDFFGISMRGRFTRWFYSYDSDLSFEDTSNSAGWDAAGMIRGVGDGSISARSMFLFNFDFTFHIFNFMFSEYLKDERLRLINFELQAAPVIDIAIIDGVKVDNRRNFIRNITYRAHDWIVGGGIELFVFPLAFRSIYLCASAVWNLNELFDAGVLPGNNDLELYIGFGHHY
jgi:hypothetical protein